MPLRTVRPTLEISWERFHRDAVWLSSRIRDSKIKYDTILAISRGGLALSHILAVELDLRHVHTICLESFSGNHRVKRSPEILGGASPHNLGDKVLVVDDLIDSGASFSEVRDFYSSRDLDLAVLYDKRPDKVENPFVRFYVDEISPKVWIKFPWENYN